jgi:hypothetical protein
MGNKVYTVSYRLEGYWGEDRHIDVLARNKAEAYDIAVYEMIPEIHSYSPYSAWVSGVTYNNGNYHRFNTCDGLPY